MAILIVDDDAELCGLMTEYLSSQGYAVECAHDGASALARAYQRPYEWMETQLEGTPAAANPNAAACQTVNTTLAAFAPATPAPAAAPAGTQQSR